MYTAVFDAPFGTLTLAEAEGKLVRIWFPAESPPAQSKRETPLLLAAQKQLEEYFRGTRSGFELPLCAGGTPFQQRCWQALREVPYGETVSYGWLAQRIGHPKAARAVGQAMHRNPIPIIIPCHRVVGGDGSLTGFGGGLDIKRILLRHEQSTSRCGKKGR